MVTSPDLRKHPRFSVDIEAQMQGPDGRRQAMRTRDVSRTGICLITDSAITIGNDLALELVLAFANRSRSEPLKVRARVVWCTGIAGAYQVGAMFDELSEGEEAYLDMFLNYLDGTIGAKEDEEADEDQPPVSPDVKDDPFRS